MKLALTTCRLFTPRYIPLFLKPSPATFSLKFSFINPKPKIPLGFWNSFRTMSSPTMPSTSLPTVEVRESIDLTDKERQIFDRLLQVLRHFNLHTQLRVAGGWVRDKLLGKECYDIDIALDNMLGREFCEKVNEYLIHTGEESHGIAVIQSNPDQSKHLETARMRLYDIWIDFVNLRSEDYSENSRIPTMESEFLARLQKPDPLFSCCRHFCTLMCVLTPISVTLWPFTMKGYPRLKGGIFERFGTAEEDAYRRDLTINSLFYNINSSSVEDFTGRGIADLRSGKIVTPLPPRETFLDDPLRVLRAIRFGSRFEFILDEELKKAASEDDVKDAIAEKISRERIGHEIDLMISGNQPVKAMTYLSKLLLFGVVFNPPNFEPPSPEGHDRLCVAYIDAAWRLVQLIGGSSFNGEQKRLALYAALFLPFRQTLYRDNKSKKIPVASYIFRNSLKLKSSDAETVVSLHNATEKLISLIPFIISCEEVEIVEVDWKKEVIDVPVASQLRILIGLLLREIKDFWRVALLLSTLLYPNSIDSTNSSAEHFKFNERRELFNQIEDAIIRQGLDKIWEVKPLVNGKEIMSVLQLKTGGPLVREWQQKLLEWQLAHPSGSAEECIDWMKQSHSKRARME